MGRPEAIPRAPLRAQQPPNRDSHRVCHLASFHARHAAASADPAQASPDPGEGTAPGRLSRRRRPCHAPCGRTRARHQHAQHRRSGHGGSGSALTGAGSATRRLPRDHRKNSMGGRKRGREGERERASRRHPCHPPDLRCRASAAARLRRCAGRPLRQRR